VKRILIVTILILAGGTPNPVLSAGHEINAPETDALVQAAINAEWPHAKKFPGLGVESEVQKDVYYPKFRFFYVTWAGSPKGGSAVVGSIAIDPLTADVWNGVMCEEIRSPQVAAIQRKIRRRIGLSDRQYRSLKAPGPLC
jgi:hypothetical protein